jgi:hypothetical protein
MMVAMSLFADTLMEPPLTGHFDPKVGLPLLALCLTFVAFVTTIRLWLKKAELDARDAISKENIAQATAVANAARTQWTVQLAGRAESLRKQLSWLVVIDLLAITMGMLCLTVLFGPWQIVVNWFPAGRPFHPAIAAFQCFSVTVLVLLFMYVRFHLLPAIRVEIGKPFAIGYLVGIVILPLIFQLAMR